MYIITSDGNGVTEEDFKKLDNIKCKRKIIFTSKSRPEIKDSFYLKSLNKYETAARHMVIHNRVTDLCTWIDDWDFVAWLNDEDQFDRS